MSEVYCRVCDEQNLDSPACLANVTPKKSRKPPVQPTLLKNESVLEVPGKNGNKLTDMVNSKPKEEERKRRASFVDKRKSENIEFEIADDASSLNDQDTDLSKPTKLGNIEDNDPALVMVNGTEELPSVEVTRQKTAAKATVNTKPTNSVKNKEAKKTDQSNKNVWSRLSAQKKNNNVSRTTKSAPKREVAKPAPKIVQKDKKSVKPIVSMMKQINIKDSNKTSARKPVGKKSKDLETKIVPNQSKVAEIEKTTDIENNIISNKTPDPIDDVTDNNGIEKAPSNTNMIVPSSTDLILEEPDIDCPNSNGLSEETREDLAAVNSNCNSENLVTLPSIINEKIDNSRGYEMIDEMTRFKRNFDHTASHITTVKVGDRTYCTLPKRKRDSVHHSMWYRETVRVPMRTTPDGTDIYYWCDISKEQDKNGKNLYFGIIIICKSN